MKTSLFSEWMYDGVWMRTENMLRKVDEELNAVDNYSLPTNFNVHFELDYKKKYLSHYYF